MRNTLARLLIDFVGVIARCLRKTTFVEDRRVCARDLAVASSWLSKLQQGAGPGGVAREIVSPEARKYFFDHWRQGSWGEQQTEASSLLLAEISRIGANQGQDRKNPTP